jgi:F0F1-type ATP synthase epsilon subunit
MAAYSLKIITPQGVAYEGSVYHTLVPAESGFVGVLAHHAPYLLSSRGGRMVIKESIGLERDFEVGPGFFEVHHNQAVFLTQDCILQS